MTDARWPAPLAARPLHATVDVPGSKSLTNRHLLLGAIAEGPSVVRGALHSRDAALMVDALGALGAGVRTEVRGPGVWDVQITPPAGALTGGQVDVGLAGTVMRFIPPLAVLAQGDVHLDGDERSRERPIGPIIEGLRTLGAQVSAATGTDGQPVLPLTVHGTGSFTGGEVTIDASGSSQFVSGLLLSAPAWQRGVTITHQGAAVPSLPHVEMTLGALRDRGVAVSSEGASRWQVHPGPVAGGEVTIEPDLSNAAVFLAAAMIAGGTVRVPRWPENSLQPYPDVREVFGQLGGSLELADGHLTLRGPGAAGLRPIEADLSRIGELTPTIAAMCALAPGRSRLSGVAHLRTHETDRLAAITTEITRLGGVCREIADGLEIEGRPPADLHGAAMETYHDHRMATFAALLGLVVADVEIIDVETTQKTLPHFTERWSTLVEGR